MVGSEGLEPPKLLEYDRQMKRLLQVGTFLFLLATFLAPLTECFDRWDPPGISNDTEFAVFALMFALCLVLVVSKLIAAFALLVDLVSQYFIQRSGELRPIGAKHGLDIFIPPLLSAPLRI
jgi:hypothetical protein